MIRHCGRDYQGLVNPAEAVRRTTRRPLQFAGIALIAYLWLRCRSYRRTRDPDRRSWRCVRERSLILLVNTSSTRALFRRVIANHLRRARVPVSQSIQTDAGDQVQITLACGAINAAALAATPAPAGCGRIDDVGIWIHEVPPVG